LVAVTGAGDPLVSVITPAYNCEKYLENCVESVRAQVFPDWEMIIVNDGSTDSTLEVASRFAALDPRITALHHPDRGNRGVSATRNLAIGASRGSYVAFLDADDEWLPTKLARQSEVLNSSPNVDLSFAKVQCVGPDGNHVRHPDWPRIEWVLGHAPSPGFVDQPFEAFVSANIGIQIPTVVARRRAVIDAGGFPIGLQHQVEDSVLWGRICRASKIHYSDEVLALYRVHQENFTSTLDPIAQIDSFWELYTRLLDGVATPEPELSSAMLGCIDRYLTAWGSPISVRWRRARLRARFLSEHGMVSEARARSRFLTAPPIGLKRRVMVHFRRMLGVGPVPWRKW